MGGDVNKTFVPFHWLALFSTAGLTSAEHLAVIYAATKIWEDDGGRWLGSWSSSDIAAVSGVHRHVVARAKRKLLSAGLIELVSPAAKAIRRAEVWDFSLLAENRSKAP